MYLDSKMFILFISYEYFVSKSYGGYMTTKIIEANSGLFVAGLAVAPVTDWRYYGIMSKTMCIFDINI